MNTEIDSPSSPELKPAIRLLTWLTACYCFSLVGYIGTSYSQGLWFWYVSQRRPAWNPPNWSVTPVWTILYGLMGFASWAVWNSPACRSRTITLGAFFVQLTLTAAWPWVLFALHRTGAAVILLFILWMVSILVTILFWRINPKSGALMTPPTVWTGFTAILTLVVWQLNR
jgi:tryptophan-rich sensory protein